MIDQSDVLERLRRVQELLEVLRDRDAEFSERLLRHEYESAQERAAITTRIDDLGIRQVDPLPPVTPLPVSVPSLHHTSFFTELVASRYGQLLIVSVAVALLAWAGVPIKRWAEGVPLPDIQDDDDGGDLDAND